MESQLKMKADATKAKEPPPLPRAEKPPFLLDQASSGSEIGESANVGQQRSILVVDDNEVVLKAFEVKLKASGFKVTTTSNAATVAGTAASARAELIILDIHFPSVSGPEWSGFTVMQWLRRFPEVGNIPVILISGDDRDKYQERALAEGAVALFQKPVNYQELLDLMLHTLQMRQ